MAIVELKEVYRTYKMGKVEVPAIRGINLTIKRGEFIAIMGPSGSGKSTLMHMVGCLDIPDNGEIYLEDDDIAKLHESDLAQIRGKKIGFIFQQFNLINSLNALENVALAMSFQGVKEKERIIRAKELLDIVGLKDRISHLPNELSGGEQQRVAIARSLANNPDIILADEPTGNLDSVTGKKVMEFFTKLNKDGKTIILITHDKDVAKYAKRIIKIRDGRIEKWNIS